MDPSCIVLSCLLMFQMTSTLVFLNPVNDVRKTTRALNNMVKNYKSLYYLGILLYFGAVAYLGIISPLKKIHLLITNNVLNEFEKMLALHQIEKNYFIAGFSLFMFVVLYGVRALTAYAATLLQLSISSSQSFVGRHTREQKKSLGRNGKTFTPENILPNLLKVKRSVSYETILFGSELREQLRALFKNTENRKGIHSTSTIRSDVSTLCTN
ncbi:uncharacterized protein LOC112044655 [Bicyclus anynana]|uniref:Uncharacterized protein LOC112044655 n=1 Tax=Bicyclus anynana TaxID=110368 RepID=A0A6J1MTW0_BICAN|nr:uncharacterized protein LOC112044655 [Bicyclus anynana]